MFSPWGKIWRTFITPPRGAGRPRLSSGRMGARKSAWCTVGAALSLVVAFATPLTAGTPHATGKVPITHLLDPDGRLRLDGSVNSSIDPAGYRMVTNASGTPRFLTAPPPGAALDGPVLALAVSGSVLYVGGDFKMAGGMDAHYVARWDGASWSEGTWRDTQKAPGDWQGVVDERAIRERPSEPSRPRVMRRRP